MRRTRSVVGLGLVAALVGPSCGDAREHDGLTRTGSTGFVDVIARGGAVIPGAHTIAPGIQLARLRPGEIEALEQLPSKPDLSILPRLHQTTDLAIPIIGVPTVETQGFTGKGVYVGMVDSGFDVKHPALRDATGATRFAWLLDYSRRVRGGKYAALEQTYATQGCLTKQDDGTAGDGGACTLDPRCSDIDYPCAVTQGAVFSGADIDILLNAASPAEPVPTDDEGHGTHAMGIAAGTKLANTPFRGVASEARMVGVKSGGSGSSIDAGVVVQGVQFIFDRAKDAGVAASVNLSLASDFTVRDGTDPLGPSIAALARGPGRIVVVAAGNAGDPTVPTHQTASVASGEHVRIGVRAFKGIPHSSVQIIVSPHSGSDLRIGVETPTGPWVTPVPRGTTRSATVDGGVANVIFDPKDFLGRLPDASPSALVTMDGQLETGLTAYYGVVLEGSGTADLWIAGGLFEYGVREQTVGSPAMHPDLIAVGASISRSGYRSLAGENFVLQSQLFDSGGMLPLVGVGGPPAPGQIAAFSGAGPGPMGVIKPDLVAPGVAIVSAATSTGNSSILIGTGACPPLASGGKTQDDHCSFIDADHAAATGTSFAAPFVAGAAAILLQADPTLTQAEMRVALQAGVHRHRSPPRFAESASVGELDVPGALLVAQRTRNPVTVLPAMASSWITANSHYAPSDGSRPLEVLVHLRTASGEPADGFDVNRFAVTMAAGSDSIPPDRLERLGPGLWAASFDVSRRGTSVSVTLAATLDQQPVGAPLSLPVALDPWQARYPSDARGASCGVSHERAARDSVWPWLFVALGAIVARRRAAR